jgi:L-asparaginase
MLEPRRPLVAILATGGTIAGVQTTANISSYQAAAFSVNQLIEAVPSLRNVASIRAEQIANLGSQDMTNEVWLFLARRIDELRHDDAVDGIVVTHCTDTIEETAYFLSMVVRHEKALVLVGAASRNRA